MKRNADKIFEPGKSKVTSVLQFTAFLFTRPGIALLAKLGKRKLTDMGFIRKKHVDYDRWIREQTDDKAARGSFQASYNTLKSHPAFTIITAIMDDSIGNHFRTVASIKNQLYDKWNLVIIAYDQGLADGHEQATTIPDDQRVTCLTTPVGLSLPKLYNKALRTSTGDYLLFLHPGDELTEDCLFRFALAINSEPHRKIIYSDHDCVSGSGKYSAPVFKPAWSPDTLLSRNYIGSAFVVQTSLLHQTGSFSEDLPGGHLYDLVVRATEIAGGAGHIKRVLFHLRSAPPPESSSQLVVQRALDGRGIPADVATIAGAEGCNDVRYRLRGAPLVSIIIPTRDQCDLLKAAIDSIIEKTSYPNYEIIVLNNNSESREFGLMMQEYALNNQGRFRCLDASFPFNFSRLINTGVANSTGDYILMLNNDVTVLDTDWLERMTGYAQQPHIGAVGARLLYPDNTIQHAGIVFGAEGDASHLFAGLPADNKEASLVSATNYSAVTGACLMCRRKVYDDVGGMDEAFAVEFNDLDLCLKMRAHGYYNVYLPSVTLYHYESATRGHPFRNRKAWQQHEKELSIFKARWEGVMEHDPFYNPDCALPIE